MGIITRSFEDNQWQIGMFWTSRIEGCKIILFGINYPWDPLGSYVTCYVIETTRNRKIAFQYELGKEIIQ